MSDRFPSFITSALRASKIEPDSILTSDEAAEAIGVQSRTMALWRWKNHGPPHITVNRRVYYRKKEVEKFLKGLTSPKKRDGKCHS